MNTRQANQVVVALTRLTGEPVYLERNFIGEKTPEVLVGTIARFERTGPRHGDFERYVVKAGAAAEEYQPA